MSEIQAGDAVNFPTRGDDSRHLSGVVREVDDSRPDGVVELHIEVDGGDNANYMMTRLTSEVEKADG